MLRFRTSEREKLAAQAETSSSGPAVISAEASLNKDKAADEEKKADV